MHKVKKNKYLMLFRSENWLFKFIQKMRSKIIQDFSTFTMCSYGIFKGRRFFYKKFSPLENPVVAAWILGKAITSSPRNIRAA